MKKLLCIGFWLCLHFNAATQSIQSQAFQFDSSRHVEDLISKAIIASKNDSAAAVKMFKQAAQNARSINDKFMEGKAFYAMGEMNFKNGAFNKAFGNFLNARTAYENGGYKTESGFAMLNIARSQYYRGNYRNAVSSFLEAIKIAEALDNKQLLRQASENLALIYNAFQNFGQSIHYYKKSLAIQEGLGDKIGALGIMQKLSDLYYENKKFDSALYYAELATAISQNVGSQSDLILSQFSKIAALIRLNKWQQAEKEFTFFDRNPIGPPNTSTAIKYQIMMGNYHLAKHDKIKSQVHYDSAIKVATIVAFPELHSLVYKNMAESYYELKDFKTAYDYSQKYFAFISQLYSGENAINLGNLEGVQSRKHSKDEIAYLSNENKLKELKLLRELEMRQNLERENLLKDSLLYKEKMLSDALTNANTLQTLQLNDEKKLRAALKRENNLQTASINANNQMRLVLLFGLAIAVILAGIIFYQYKKQRNKNIIIQKQAEDLQTLMKEIHHRVKNNLQIISSLLDLQSLTIKDGQASEAVKEGKNRVQSMALIHQNLYNEGNIKGIIVHDYIHNLAQSLFDSYNIEKDKVKLTTDIDHMNLDIDTVIPIGLIVNELISNSLKYAFKNKSNGELSVVLKQEGNELLLRVQDNGNGFKSGWNSNGEQSFGFKLIKAFAQKLKGKLDVYNDNGACVSMRIKKYKMA